MAVCAPTEDEAWATARESFEWYPKAGARLDRVGGASGWRSASRTSATTATPPTCKHVADDGSLDLLSLEYLVDSGACVLGTPDECVEMCKRYEAAGVDLLLCLVNPYKIPHEAVMQTIELMGSTSSRKFR